MNDDLRVHRTQEEVILILGPDPARMRQAEEVQLVVARSARASSGTPGGERRGEVHEVIPGGVGMRWLHNQIGYVRMRLG